MTVYELIRGSLLWAAARAPISEQALRRLREVLERRNGPTDSAG